MKLASKLAHLRGARPRVQIQDVLHSARKAFETKVDRLCARPLRDLDGWSDQAEVAFYEEAQGWRA